MLPSHQIFDWSPSPTPATIIIFPFTSNIIIVLTVTWDIFLHKTCAHDMYAWQPLTSVLDEILASYVLSCTSGKKKKSSLMLVKLEICRTLVL